MDGQEVYEVRDLFMTHPDSQAGNVFTSSSNYESLASRTTLTDLPGIHRSGCMSSSIRTSGRNVNAKWIERLGLLKNMRRSIAQEPSTDHIISSIDVCIDSIAKHLESSFNLESPVHIPAQPTKHGADTVNEPIKRDAREFAEGNDSESCIYPESGQLRARSSNIPQEETKLPGRTSYTMENVVETLDTLDIAEDEDEIPNAFVLEANDIECHLNKPLVRKLYSRRWMRRINAIDEIVTLIERNTILDTNGHSIQQVVVGVGKILSRLFQDHALKVLIKSLELLDAFFDFMERNGCCALTSARISTARNTAVNCGSEFVEVLIGRMGDRVSAVVNCAVCALLKVAESNTIPTYEDVANCLIRSLGVYNQHPGIRSICNRLRLLSTILLRAHTYNSHNVSRFSIKPCHLFECLNALCHHSNGEVRAMALEAMAVGVKVYFKDVTVNLDSTTRDAVERIPVESVSVYEGNAANRTTELLSDAQATWAVDILRARTPPQW
ncbi:hypothetical protein X943_003426 [Babesia divergens]|uniref:TOG domain-containing protein n=1 Tax=Babesia divergens TaxID=32595 RepID=A0AAD9GKZ3_BABDI|nr:hypothetical protein X943_003426 [Babesia divergens]